MAQCFASFCFSFFLECTLHSSSTISKGIFCVYVRSRNTVSSFDSYIRVPTILCKGAICAQRPSQASYRREMVLGKFSNRFKKSEINIFLKDNFQIFPYFDSRRCMQLQLMEYLPTSLCRNHGYVLTSTMDPERDPSDVV